LTNPVPDEGLSQELRFLRQRLYWLCWTWKDYKTLFINNGNQELLSQAIGSLARLIQVSLLDSIQLDIRALSEIDRDIKSRNTNLSMYRLVHWLDQKQCDAVATEEVRAALEAAGCESERLKKRRDKLNAHYDLGTIVNERQFLLEWPAEEEISTVVTLLIKAMNAAERALGECIFDYAPLDDGLRDGANSLIAILKSHDQFLPPEPDEA
jgi:hypothetical protein